MTPQEIVALADSSPLITDWLRKGRNDKADSDFWACPNCGSGTHEHGTGAFVLYNDHAHCYSCGKTIYNSGLAQIELGLPNKAGENYNKVAEILAEKLNVSYDEARQPQPKGEGADTMTPNSRGDNTKDYTGLYKRAQSQLEATLKKYDGTWRGLTLEDLRAVHAGAQYDKLEGLDCVYLPFDSSHYFKRSMTGKVKKFIKGTRQIYNPYDVLKTPNLIFVLEGEIDALTVHKFGYSVIALGSANNGGLLMKAINSGAVAQGCKFVIMFDNNDNGTGQRCAGELTNKLLGVGFAAVNETLSPKGYDANQWLQLDAAGLKSRLEEIYTQAAQKLKELEERAKLKVDLYGIPLRFFFQYQFTEALSKSARFNDFETGIETLDRAQDWQHGIYCIGAPPSLGKTSFIWQVLESAARQSFDNHCIFVSLEMSALDLYSKSIARRVYQINLDSDKYFSTDKPLTAAAIRKKQWFWDKYAEFEKDCGDVIEEFERAAATDDAGNEQDIDLRVLDFSESRIDIDTLIERLQAIADSVPPYEPLIFGVDYLQLVKNDKFDVPKLAVDDIMEKLKNFVNRNDCIIFLVSSYNRGAYRTEADFSGFKESGSIEYFASVVWALQLHALEQKDSGEYEYSSSAKVHELAKQSQPRPMCLKCLKNRYGNDYRLYFQYFSAVDLFVGCTEKDLLEG